MATTKKIQLLLDEPAQDTLAALQQATGANSAAEVLRDALGVYNSLCGLLNGTGLRLALLDRSSGTMQELIIPSLLRTVAPVVVLHEAKP